MLSVDRPGEVHENLCELLYVPTGVGSARKAASALGVPTAVYKAMLRVEPIDLIRLADLLGDVKGLEVDCDGVSLYARRLRPDEPEMPERPDRGVCGSCHGRRMVRYSLWRGKELCETCGGTGKGPFPPPEPAPPVICVGCLGFGVWGAGPFPGACRRCNGTGQVPASWG